jgi:hypothetical protein
MKTFHVELKNKKKLYIQATAYRRESDQYVFDKDGADVQFVLVSEVVSITEGEPPFKQVPVQRA